MKILKVLAVSFALTMASCAAEAKVVVVPRPLEMTEGNPAVTINGKMKVYCQVPWFLETVDVWAGTRKQIDKKQRLPMPVSCDNSGLAHVKLMFSGLLDKEEYKLSVDPRKFVTITAGSVQAAWWAMQTLDQIMLQCRKEDGRVVLPQLEIRDCPKYAYRGAHLDCSRHFFTVDEVKTFIDMLAIHKLNVFHWHLTDDQGWRIEIKKYPKLTKVGSVRRESPVGHIREHNGGDGKQHVGYYTQKQAADIVSYAKARHITVIPEIELPGHAEAALAAYPQFGCLGKDYEVWTEWGVNKEVFCVGKDGTLAFLKDILDEICAIFPSEYIHIGGDECPRDRWKTCPDCQAKIKELGLKSEDELQGYLVNEIEKYLNAKGRKIIGWDEILNCGISQTATVMSWRGAKGGKEAALRGNDVIMAPNSHFYLDYYQTADPKANGEPLAIGGHLNLEKCYSFNPVEGLDAEARRHIKGIQANTWTEYISDFDHIQHMDLPRFAALSEVCWCESKTPYPDFLSRVGNGLVPLYKYYGYNYATYAFDGIE